MSRETTEARAEAIWAEARWREHRARDCARCSIAAGSRKWDELCQEGHALRQAHIDATAELNRNRQLDKLPSLDQEPLFPELGAAGRRSFSNGNAGPDEDLWSGWVLRPVHWWHWAQVAGFRLGLFLGLVLGGHLKWLRASRRWRRRR